MRDHDLDPEFSWPLAFFVTGVCFLAFHYILVKLNESSPRVFLWIGIASLIISFVAGAVSLWKKSKTNSQQEQTD